MLKTANDYEHRGRLIARIVRVLLATESFDSLADLTDALKWRLARLNIRWTNDDISSAYTMIASNTPLSGTPPRPPSSVSRDPELVLSRGEAAAILERLGIRL